MLRIIRIIVNLKSFFKMKFNFDGVGKISSKIRIFKRKFERTQDVEMRSRSLSSMKVDKPRSNHISQTFNIDHLTEED